MCKYVLDAHVDVWQINCSQTCFELCDMCDYIEEMFNLKLCPTTNVQ